MIRKSTARRFLMVLSAWLLLAGLVCLSQAQVPSMGFPPGVFHNRTALDGTAAPTAVTPDVLGTEAFQSLSNNFNYNGLTITAGLTNPALVCWLIRGSAALDVSTGIALTWNGTTMALRASQSGAGVNTYAFLFGLRNPASGAQTLNVSATNIAADNFVNCASFSNVNPTSDALAFPNPVSTNAAVTTIAVTSAAGHIAAGAFSSGAGSGTILGQTVIDNQVSGAIINAAADWVVSSGASTNVGSSTTQSTIVGMDISN